MIFQQPIENSTRKITSFQWSTHGYRIGEISAIFIFEYSEDIIAAKERLRLTSFLIDLKPLSVGLQSFILNS